MADADGTKDIQEMAEVRQQMKRTASESDECPSTYKIFADAENNGYYFVVVTCRYKFADVGALTSFLKVAFATPGVASTAKKALENNIDFRFTPEQKLELLPLFQHPDQNFAELFCATKLAGGYLYDGRWLGQNERRECLVGFYL